MPLPRGNLMTPVGITAAGVLQALLCDADGRLVVSGTFGLYDAYVCVRDVKAAGVDGGVFTSGAWRIRDINDEQADTANICTIAGNVITLAAGTYQCRIACPGVTVRSHQARLYDNTADEVVLAGTSSGTGAAYSMTTSVIIGRFTLSEESALQVEHRCELTRPATGMGLAVNWSEVEIYTVAEFWREA